MFGISLQSKSIKKHKIQIKKLNGIKFKTIQSTLRTLLKMKNKREKRNNVRKIIQNNRNGR